jgi:MFS family permease
VTVRPPAEDPAVVLDPGADPGGAALGTSGAEATSALPWFTLLHRRVQGRAARSPRYQWWVLGALLAGLLSLNVTFTVFVVALPTVARELHTNISVLTWTSTGPLLAFGLAAPVLGRAGDLFGHRRLYLWGLVGAMVCAVLTATAPDAGVLVMARALDGIEGAATGTASMALVLRVFAPEDRVKAMGWWSLVGAGGPVLGVTVGAPVIEFMGWRALFWGQLGLLVLSAVVVMLVLPSHGRRAIGPAGRRATTGGEPERPDTASADGARRSWREIDWIGSTALSIGLTLVMLALNLGPILGWPSVGVLVSAALGTAALAGFAWREVTAVRPLIPVRYFRRRNFVMPMAARACTSFAYFGGFFLFPLLMEQVYSMRVAQVGLISIARPLVFSLSAPVAGYLAVRIGERTSAVIGALSILASMVLFALLSPSATLTVIVLALCLSGLGMGVASPSTSSTMANEVDASEFGVMSAAQQLAMQVGEVAGIQVLQSVEESSARSAGLSTLHHTPALLPSFHHAFWVGAGVAVVGTVCAAGMRSAQRVVPVTPAGEPAVAQVSS